MPRDVVDLDWFGDHHGVVLNDQGGAGDGPFAVIVMTSKEPKNDPEPFFVDPSSYEGRALGLTLRTYFLRGKVRIFELSELRPNGKTCPYDLHVRLRELAGLP